MIHELNFVEQTMGSTAKHHLSELLVSLMTITPSVRTLTGSKPLVLEQVES